MTMSNTNTIVLCAVAAACASATSVYAQHAVSIATEVERIENPSLAAVSPGGATVLRVIPNYTYETQGDRTRSRFSAGAVVERSNNTRLLANRTYPSLGYSWAYTWPTAELELRANLAESSTRNTELEDLGRVTVDSRERTMLTGATWRKELTSRSQLTLGAENQRVTYDSPLLQDYRQQEVSTRYSWDATERTTYYVEPAYARLTPTGGAGTPVNSSRNRLLLGMRGQLAPDLELTASAGHVRARGASDLSGGVGGLRLTHTGSQLTSEVEWSRRIDAVGSVSGYVRTQVFRASLSYQLSEASTLSAGLTRSESAGVLASVGRVFSVALHHELNANWTSMLGVEDRRSRFISGDSGKGWSVRGGLVYMFPGR